MCHFVKNKEKEWRKNAIDMASLTKLRFYILAVFCFIYSYIVVRLAVLNSKVNHITILKYNFQINNLLGKCKHKPILILLRNMFEILKPTYFSNQILVIMAYLTCT